jgi:hypothetical protein
VPNAALPMNPRSPYVVRLDGVRQMAAYPAAWDEAVRVFGPDRVSTYLLLRAAGRYGADQEAGCAARGACGVQRAAGG